MTGSVSPPAEPTTAAPAPRRPTHASLAAIADLVGLAIHDARTVLARAGEVGDQDDGGRAGRPSPSPLLRC